jgi:hypothetical protein
MRLPKAKARLSCTACQSGLYPTALAEFIKRPQSAFQIGAELLWAVLRHKARRFDETLIIKKGKALALAGMTAQQDRRL